MIDGNVDLNKEAETTKMPEPEVVVPAAEIAKTEAVKTEVFKPLRLLAVLFLREYRNLGSMIEIKGAIHDSELEHGGVVTCFKSEGRHIYDDGLPEDITNTMDMVIRSNEMVEVDQKEGGLMLIGEGEDSGFAAYAIRKGVLTVQPPKGWVTVIKLKYGTFFISFMEQAKAPSDLALLLRTHTMVESGKLALTIEGKINKVA